jgi:hypothetical protein
MLLAHPGSPSPLYLRAPLNSSRHMQRLKTPVWVLMGKTCFKASILMCFASLTAACNHFGYYKHQKAERAPAEEAAAIKFPDSMEQWPWMTTVRPGSTPMH